MSFGLCSMSTSKDYHVPPWPEILEIVDQVSQSVYPPLNIRSRVSVEIEESDVYRCSPAKTEEEFINPAKYLSVHNLECLVCMFCLRNIEMNFYPLGNHAYVVKPGTVTAWVGKKVLRAMAEAILQWSKTIPLEWKSLSFIVNTDEKHWVTLSFRNDSKKMLIYDSNGVSKYSFKMRFVIYALKYILSGDALLWRNTQVRCTKQSNMVDCGVYAVLNALQVIDNQAERIHPIRTWLADCMSLTLQAVSTTPAKRKRDHDTAQSSGSSVTATNVIVIDDDGTHDDASQSTDMSVSDLENNTIATQIVAFFFLRCTDTLALKR